MQNASTQLRVQWLPLCILTYLFVQPAPSLSAEAPRRINPEGIHGALVICGGGEPSAAVQQQFVELARGKQARILVIPTTASVAEGQADLKPWSSYKVVDVALLRVGSREDADKESVLAALKQATGVWFAEGDSARVAEMTVGTAFERELSSLLERGGVIGGTGPGAAILSRVMITGGEAEPKLGTGFDLLPDAIIACQLNQPDRAARLARAMEQHPNRVGFGIDGGAALVVRGRDLHVLGEGHVTVQFGKSQRPARPAAALSKVWKPGANGDLVSLQRAARARVSTPFPPDSPVDAVVEQGSLVIVGGGGMPPDVVKRFIELAGGPDALIVILPTADPPHPRANLNQEGRFLERAGAKKLKVLPQRTASEVSSPEFLDALKEAGGIWFGGGRQWRFVDAYEDTPAVAAMQGVLKRGGVIGGSSAGATIQGDYLCRGSPLGNLEIMAEGYERGFGFLPGTAIDQHFAQRKRFPDMSQLKSAYPQLLGIGIDEATALIVRGSEAEVLGKSQVHFYGRTQPPANGDPEYVSISSGGVYDLKARKQQKP